MPLSLLQRLRRAFETRLVPMQDPGVLYGEAGEREVARRIDQLPGSFRLANPIAYGYEADHLVYIYGTIFCIEVKYWKQSRVTRLDERTVVRQKIGNYGEVFPPQEHRCPLKQASTFLYHLKQDLCRIDSRFRSVHLVPVAVFAPETDISAIHDRHAGIISLDELIPFFQLHAHAQKTPVRWIMEALAQVHALDVIETTRQEVWKGCLQEQDLSFQRAAGMQHLSLHTVRSIVLEHGWRFSASDMIIVEKVDGSIEVMHCVSGAVHLTLLDAGQTSVTHLLRNIVYIKVGRANKPRR